MTFQWTKALTALAIGAFLWTALPAAAQQSQHDQIVEHYGGAYTENGIDQYVRSIVARLEPHARLRTPIRHVTVLNSPVINAFATPEGGVYVTRGIVALANSEDELAGVIGHEIAHVAEGHGDSRQSLGLGAAIVGVIAQAAGAGDLAMLGYNVGANLGLSSYSRSQEADADRLGVAYLVRAGYDPFALHDFFYSMQADAELQQRLTGQGQNPIAAMEFFSTHPNTEGRVQATYDRAARNGRREGDVERIIQGYMNRIDGMSYGDGDEQGFVRGQTFYHPDLGFQFSVPAGYRLQNGASAVTASHQDGSRIRFDLGQNQSRKNLAQYVVGDFAQELDVALTNAQSFTINGIAAANARGTATVNNRRVDVFAVVFDTGSQGQIYRFVMSGPAGRTFDSRGWFDTQDSFRRFSGDQAQNLHALTVETYQARPGDTVESLSRNMAFDDYRMERFRALNGLRRNEAIAPGEWYKVVED